MSKQGSRSSAILVTAAAVAVGFAGVYATLGQRAKTGPSLSETFEKVKATQAEAQPASATTPATTGPAGKLNVGQMTTFVFKKEPEAPAEVAFKGRSGENLTLKAWSGRVVLLNLWATWCAPCRKEMPALDKLQREMGGKDFEVVALAADRAGADAAQKFLDQVEARGLGLYVDSTARSASALKAVGMPTTILIDRKGREIGRLAGPAEWDSEDAKRLIRSLF